MIILVVELSWGLEAYPGDWRIFQLFKKKIIKKQAEFRVAVNTLSRYCNYFAFPRKQLSDENKSCEDHFLSWLNIMYVAEFLIAMVEKE